MPGRSETQNGPRPPRRPRLFHLVITCALAGGSAGAQTFAELYDKTASQILRPANDSYVVILRVRHYGKVHTARTEDRGTSQFRGEWNVGPAEVHARLVTDPQERTLLLSDQRGMNLPVQLALWKYYLLQVRKAMQPVSPGSHGSDQKLTEILAPVIEAAEGYGRDAELIVELFGGLHTYSMRSPNPSVPFVHPRDAAPLDLRSSQDLEVVFHGGSQVNRYSQTPAPGWENDPWSLEPVDEVSRAELPPWSSRSQASPAAMDFGEPPSAEKWDSWIQSAGQSLLLLVWEFDPKKMDRLGDLAVDIDRIGKNLTVSGSLENPVARQRLDALSWQIHKKLRDPLIEGIREIVRLTWDFGPHQVPADLFLDEETRDIPVMRGLAIQDTERRELAPEAELRLPPLASGKLIRFSFPRRGLPHHPRGRFIYSSIAAGLSEEFMVWKTRLSGGGQYTAVGRGWNRWPYPKSQIDAEVSGDQFTGELTLTGTGDEQTSADGVKRRYQGQETIEIAWDIKREVTPEEPKLVDYIPPPVLAFESAHFPEDPAPGEAVTVAFRAENRGTITIADTEIDFSFLDPGTRGEPDETTKISPPEPFCASGSSPDFECALGDFEPGDVVDLVFDVEMPQSGLFLWSANWTSAGDLGGPTQASGGIGKPEPEVLDVVVIEDQDEVRDMVVSYGYPHSPGARESRIRHLLVVGRNLPQEFGEEMRFDSLSENVSYSFYGFPESSSSGPPSLLARTPANFVMRSLYRDGWNRFFDVEEEVDPVAPSHAASQRAEELGLEGLLVRAHLKEGVLPGIKTLSLNDVEGKWELEFGDLRADLVFVRAIGGSRFDRLETAYRPEAVHFAVLTNKLLPLDEIPVVVDAERLGGGKDRIELIASRAPLLDARVYLTPPLVLFDAGRSPPSQEGVLLPIAGSPPDGHVLRAWIDETFLFQDLRVPTNPPIASIEVQRSPRRWLWKEALHRAAKCHRCEPGVLKQQCVPVAVQDWDSLSKQESEEIWNLIIFTRHDHTSSLSVKFGHHAAALLLRDMFVQLMERQITELERIAASEQAIKGLFEFMKPLSHDESLPLNRMKVERFHGGETEYRSILFNDVKWLADHYGTTEEAIDAWQLRETRRAVERLIAAAKKTIAAARDAGECEVEELLELTGFHFEPVARVLVPHLVRLSEQVLRGEPALVWIPDQVGREWISRVSPLAEAVRLQKLAANVDTDMALFAVALATAPLMLAEGTVVMLVAWSFEILDVVVTTVQELSQYLESQRELDISLGASVLIGLDRYKAAEENAKSWISVAFGIGTAAGGAVTSGLEVLPRLAKLRRIARGRHVAEVVTDLSKLESVDLRDFGAFAMSAYVRRAAAGAEALTEVERRAIRLVEAFPSQHTVRLPPPDLPSPPINSADTLRPSYAIQFRANADGELTVAGLPSSGLRAPRQVVRPGEPAPNALPERVPADAVVRVSTAGGEREFELGEFIGRGYTSEAYAHPADPDLVIRITYVRENAPATLLDDYGRRVLTDEVSSDHMRVAREVARYEATGALREGDISRVTLVERIPETAHDTISSQGGRMSVGQMMAFEGALRDLNAAGFVWLDNYWRNFALVPLSDGSGRWQVVVLDTGGIFKIRVPEGSVATIAERAREVQLQVNGVFENQFSRFADIRTPVFRTAVRQEAVREDFADLFDLQSMGIGRVEELLFNPRSGEDFEYVGPLFEAVD